MRESLSAYVITTSLDIQYNEDVDDFRISFNFKKYSKERSSRDQISVQKIICCKYNELNEVISQTIKTCFNFINFSSNSNCENWLDSEIKYDEVNQVHYVIRNGDKWIVDI